LNNEEAALNIKKSDNDTVPETRLSNITGIAYESVESQQEATLPTSLTVSDARRC